MTVEQDAGNLLLFFYDELIKKEKRSVNAQDVVDNINWNSNRINIAFNYLKSFGWIEKVQPYIGNTKGVQNFRVRELSSQGIGQVEDSKRFEETFGFDVKISASTIGSQHTERDLNIEKQEAKRDIINVAGNYIIHTPKTQELKSIHLAYEKSDSSSSLKIFLCHSSGDKAIVRDLYQRLKSKGFNPWLDEEDLLPGQEWQIEIPKAVKESDVVIVCLSLSSISKEGYVQKEIKDALDAAGEKPEGTIFIIPLKLEECNVPERLSRWQWVNLYEDKGFEKLMLSLQKRNNQLEKKDKAAKQGAELIKMHEAKQGIIEENKLEYSKTLVDENLRFRAKSEIGFNFVDCNLHIQIQNLPTIEDYTMYSDDVDAHLKSGYKNVWGIYENIDSLIKKHNTNAQQFAIDLKSKIMSELKQRIPKIMKWNTVGEPPAKYYTEHLLNQVVCSVLWFYKHPIDKDRIHNVFIVVHRNNRWQIDRDFSLFGSDNEIETKEIQQMIVETIDTAIKSKDFNKLKECFENIEKEHERFVKEIRKIIKNAKRGIPLKGECEAEDKVN